MADITIFRSWLLSFGMLSTVLALKMPYEFITDHTNNYVLPKLPYGYKDLEPFIDEATLRVHHLGHHAAYTKKMNAALEEWAADGEVKESASFAKKPILDILIGLEDVPEKYQTKIRNNGGGYVNHNLYWSVMSPNPNSDDREPINQLGDDIIKAFGNFSTFKEEFTKEALSLFGSGYVWLSRDPNNNGKLTISKTANQDSPLTDGLMPILVIDVWEHAYYIKHQNLRPKHVSDWWNLVDWSAVEDIDHWWLGPNYNFHDEF
ncbi:superoxide dismutase [Mn]-like [Ylistrum balloti]|uniref:superoxide dismutase [Mn]-like n=1 Tax=Ylistrum balloti TaxID=509963 RepID=UPI002905D2E8|nr:superoxide dismutase [Mn]-like [Ylistrum balloti]